MWGKGAVRASGDFWRKIQTNGSSFFEGLLSSALTTETLSKPDLEVTILTSAENDSSTATFLRGECFIRLIRRIIQSESSPCDSSV